MVRCDVAIYVRLTNIAKGVGDSLVIYPFFLEPSAGYVPIPGLAPLLVAALMAVIALGSGLDPTF